MNVFVFRSLIGHVYRSFFDFLVELRSVVELSEIQESRLLKALHAAADRVNNQHARNTKGVYLEPSSVEMRGGTWLCVSIKPSNGADFRSRVFLRWCDGQLLIEQENLEFVGLSVKRTLMVLADLEAQIAPRKIAHCQSVEKLLSSIERKEDLWCSIVHRESVVRVTCELAKQPFFMIDLPKV